MCLCSVSRCAGEAAVCSSVCVLSPDVEVKQPGVGPAVFCGLGLTVGLLGVAAGTFFLIKGNECS
ncbi:hypothetical protein D9C73_014566 [Collichthys lucidus]|uniref:Uncharacterized protein n=1 Tax=Collichthys lucidus TaxID=240159 RepID=A0A4U5UYN0_COLLU|nr:hypothetical protein D9C73_014566 [Collichthys lucidus]